MNYACNGCLIELLLLIHRWLIKVISEEFYVDLHSNRINTIYNKCH